MEPRSQGSLLFWLFTLYFVPCAARSANLSLHFIKAQKVASNCKPFSEFFGLQVSPIIRGEGGVFHFWQPRGESSLESESHEVTRLLQA
jgi:hypothetical protein